MVSRETNKRSVLLRKNSMASYSVMFWCRFLAWGQTLDRFRRMERLRLNNNIYGKEYIRQANR
jgi:hypothetical protein